MIPVLLGPKQRHYVIDHHHLARALEEEGVKNILVTVVGDLHALQKSSFWVVLDNRGWCHPYDVDGRRRDFDDIPSAVSELVDDPYHSLAGELRQAGGFAKDSTPFSEFYLDGFSAAPHQSEGHQGRFLVSAGDGTQARQDERGRLLTRLVRPSEPSRLISQFSDTIDSLFIAGFSSIPRPCRIVRNVRGAAGGCRARPRLPHGRGGEERPVGGHGRLHRRNPRPHGRGGGHRLRLWRGPRKVWIVLELQGRRPGRAGHRHLVRRDTVEMPVIHRLAFRAHQRLRALHGEDCGAPIRFDDDAGQPDIGEFGVGGTVGNRPLRRPPRRAEQRTAECRRDEFIHARALQLRRVRLRRYRSGRRSGLHAGILCVQLAEKHGAKQRTPGQKENRNAIDHCVCVSDGIGAAENSQK
jgi:hypothetical protein